YIITLSSAKPYDRSFWLSAFIIWLSIALWIIFQQNLNGIPAVIVFLALLFSACMICHGELIRLKPHQQDLTLFYLFIALGGMLGGLFTNAVLLLLLTQWWDFYVPMIIITLLVVMLGIDQLQKAKHLWNLGVASISVMVFLALLCAIFYQIYFPKQHLIAAERSLYGFLRVFDDRYPDPTLNDRRLMHGTIIHGLEYQDPAKKLWPTLYYGWNSGAGIAIKFLRENTTRPLKIGVVGLGCGTIAALTHQGDEITFYEIDDKVNKIAHHYFSFLKLSAAANQIILGDARIQLQKELSLPHFRKYDLLVIDAFNGDAIPFHLITKEAMQIYRDHLTEDGIIAFHTSNTYLDLLPVTKALATDQHCAFYWLKSHQEISKDIVPSTWALISCHKELAPWLNKQRGFDLKPTAEVSPILWTDDYNSILPLLRWR
ncbi:MAG: spermidine synthase, partial [Candidatus Berkiellales bacterium]